jgi:hypothetical protein
MPIPKPHKFEKSHDFISRFVSNSIMTKEFPNVKQRVAIAYTQLRKIRGNVK